ncbi:MAG: lasso RiPP family leader peptide-containing protein [Pseudonocardiaceae bacterium]
MDIRAEGDTEIRTERPEVYEPPTLDEIGGFIALTRASDGDSLAEEFGYYSEE